MIAMFLWSLFEFASLLDLDEHLRRRISINPIWICCSHWHGNGYQIRGKRPTGRWLGSKTTTYCPATCKHISACCLGQGDFLFCTCFCLVWVLIFTFILVEASILYFSYLYRGSYHAPIMSFEVSFAICISLWGS